MALTFTLMVTEVTREVQELMSQADLDSTRIGVIVNRAYRQFVRDTKCLSDTLDFTTVANQQFYDRNDTANWEYYFDIIDVKYIEETSEFGKSLTPYPGGYAKLPRNKSYGEPVYYYLLNEGTTDIKIGTYPIIDDAGETLQVNGYHIPTADISGSGEPVVPDDYREAIIHWANWWIFKNYGHQNSDYRAKAFDNKRFYDELVNLYKLNRFSMDQIHQVYNVDMEY